MKALILLIGVTAGALAAYLVFITFMIYPIDAKPTYGPTEFSEQEYQTIYQGSQYNQQLGGSLNE